MGILTDSEPEVGPTSTTTLTRPELLDRVPTQRTGEGLPPVAPRRRTLDRPTVAIVITALVLSMGVVASGVLLQLDRNARAAEQARVQRSMLAVQAAAAQDVAVATQASQQQSVAAGTALLAAAVADAKAAITAAEKTLDASPHAATAKRVPLREAQTELKEAVAAAGAGVSVLALRDATAAIDEPTDVVVAAEKAWAKAEAKRKAEAKAKAEAAAAAAAAASAGSGWQPSSSGSGSSGSSGSTATTSSTSTKSSSSSGTARKAVPAGGLVCQGSGGSGAYESSVSAIGSAINSYRAGKGLKALSVSRSGGLVSHSVNMANTGGIWHSGGENIVACVSSGSASAMVSAWSRSPGHNAQMLRTDVSRMSVGGAALGGWLFGAVLFS